VHSNIHIHRTNNLATHHLAYQPLSTRVRMPLRTLRLLTVQTSYVCTECRGFTIHV